MIALLELITVSERFPRRGFLVVEQPILVVRTAWGRSPPLLLHFASPPAPSMPKNSSPNPNCPHMRTVKAAQVDIKHKVEEKCKLFDVGYNCPSCLGWRIKEARIPSIALIACFITILPLRTSSGQLFAFPQSPILPASSI
jgi:hypothetical protein